MKNGIPKISVMIITYKQEELIKRALGSLLVQKEFLYEICISDDCSPDNTWRVLQEYKLNYPELIKIHRNEINRGIFENIEQVWTMPTGDVVYLMAGDDECGGGWFEKTIEFINKNKIDYKKELFCIYGDYKCIYPNGDTYTFKNDSILTGIDPVRLAIRKFISNRSTIYSINILRKFKKVSQGRSYKAEGAQDRMLQLYTETNYYIPHLGNIYYTGIGVNRHLSKADIEEVFDKGVKYNVLVLRDFGYLFSKKDLFYMQYYIEKNKFIHHKTIKHFLRAFFLYLKSFDMAFKFENFRISIYCFAILRRLPHRKPILWVINHNM